MALLRQFGLLIFLFLECFSINAQKGAITTSVPDGDKPLDTLSVDFNKRYALVIGNAGYLNNRLVNPINDANGINNTLKQYGFKVIMATDLSEQQMDSIIKDFSDTIRTNRAVGLFYFSGHGIQFNTQNFLLPISSTIETEGDISKTTTRLNGILKRLAYSKKGLNIVILDACRTNPFAGNLKDILPGLSYNLEKVRNTLIFFATSANEVAADGLGKNSPFTESLIEVISHSDSLELMQIVKGVVRSVESKTGEKQVPQYVGTLSEDFYFKKKDIVKPQVFIVSIGISNYKNLPNVPYSAQGAIDFAKVFHRLNKESYSPENIFLFTDNYVSKTKIYQTLVQLRKKARPGDIVLIYFSGIILMDGLLQSIIFPTYNYRSLETEDYIDQSILFSILSGLPCKSLLFLDGFTGYNENAQNFLLSEMMKPKNAVVVFSAGLDSRYIDDGTKGSPFTNTIIKGLEEALDPERGAVDVLSLSEYVKKKLPLISTLRPEVYFPLGWQNFVLPKLIEEK